MTSAVAAIGVWAAILLAAPRWRYRKPSLIRTATLRRPPAKLSRLLGSPVGGIAFEDLVLASCGVFLLGCFLFALIAGNGDDQLSAIVYYAGMVIPAITFILLTLLRWYRNGPVRVLARAIRRAGREAWDWTVAPPSRGAYLRYRRRLGLPVFVLSQASWDGSPGRRPAMRDLARIAVWLEPKVREMGEERLRAMGRVLAMDAESWRMSSWGLRCWLRFGPTYWTNVDHVALNERLWPLQERALQGTRSEEARLGAASIWLVAAAMWLWAEIPAALFDRMTAPWRAVMGDPPQQSS